MMLSFRHADLIPRILKKDPERGHVILENMSDTIHVIGMGIVEYDQNERVKKEPPILEKIMWAFEECGFILHDSDKMPFYVMDYEEDALYKNENALMRCVIEKMKQIGFEAEIEGSPEEPRFSISFIYYPSMGRKADLLPKVHPVKHRRGEMVKLDDLRKEDIGQPVRYIPHHASGMDHPDCQSGYISSWNHKFVFVNFGKGDTSPACDPRDLVWLMSS